jgi:hypothetical protein
MYAEEGRGREVRAAMLARIPLGRLGEPDLHDRVCSDRKDMQSA